MKVLLGFAMVLILAGCGANQALPTTAADDRDTIPATWQSLGSFPDDTWIAAPIIKVYDNDGVAVPYMAYTDSISGDVFVKKYVDGAWEAVGTGLECSTNVECSSLSLFIAEGEIPYIAISDKDNQGTNGFTAMVVYKFVNDAWEAVGSFIDLASGPSLYVYDGIPYVAYIYYDGTIPVVSKFDGENWVLVGDLSASPINSYLLENALYVVSENEIYLDASDGTDYTREYNGTSWVAAEDNPYNNIDASVTTTINAEFVAEQATLQSVATLGTVIYLAFVDADTHEIMTYKYE